MGEWQPARIAPPPAESHITYRGHFSKTQADVVGKIIRVQPTDYRDGYICGGQVLRVHPEDAVNILGLENPFGGARVCEHQILTD